MIRLTSARIEEVTHAAAYSGSGFKAGLFSEHVAQTHGRFGLTLGTSGGALAALASSMGIPDVFTELTLGYADSRPWNGIQGYSVLALHGRSLWSLAPLRRTLADLVDAHPLRHPVGVGVVCRETGRHDVVLLGPDTAPADIVDAVLASCAIAVVFDAVTASWGGTPQHWSDGGHAHYLPVLGRRDLPSLEVLDATFARPLDPAPRPSVQVVGLLDAAGWLLDAATVATMRADVDRLRLMARLGVDVRVRAPAADAEIGTTLDADAATQRARSEEAIAMMLRPPVRL